MSAIDSDLPEVRDVTPFLEPKTRLIDDAPKPLDLDFVKSVIVIDDGIGNQ